MHIIYVCYMYMYIYIHINHSFTSKPEMSQDSKKPPARSVSSWRMDSRLPPWPIVGSLILWRQHYTHYGYSSYYNKTMAITKV